MNSPAATSSDTWSSAVVAEAPRPNVFDTPASRTLTGAWVTVSVMPLRTHGRLARRGERGVERAEVEDAGQVDGLEQAERGGLARVRGQRRLVRVVGERDLLEGGRHDGRLERLAGVGGEFVVGRG